VQLAGTIVKRASLHNADQIAKLDIRIGDEVYVEKGGEIIPKIVGIAKRGLQVEPTTYITHCPECDTTLVRQAGEAQHYCSNETGCKPQIVGKVQHFISRKAMNIDGLGDETVLLLFESGLIKNYADLYDLKVEQMTPLERMAQKSAENITAGLIASKQVPFERVLFALGIRHVGETVAKKLAKYYKNIDAIMMSNVLELNMVDEIGDKIAQSVVDFFSVPDHVDLINRLKNNGLQFEYHETQVQMSEVLKGKTIVVSGVFSKYSRDELKAMIEANGGKNGSSISSKTDYLVAGDNMGPAKLEKANQLKVPIITEEDFEKLLGF
jgi:DNA ligase (NAD+)